MSNVRRAESDVGCSGKSETSSMPELRNPNQSKNSSKKEKVKIRRLKMEKFPFQVDRTYSRKHIRAIAESAIEVKDRLMCLWVGSHSLATGVIFEFMSISGGSKFVCFGMGRADEFYCNRTRRVSHVKA